MWGELRTGRQRPEPRQWCEDRVGVCGQVPRLPRYAEQDPRALRVPEEGITAPPSPSPTHAYRAAGTCRSPQPGQGGRDTGRRGSPEPMTRWQEAGCKELGCKETPPPWVSSLYFHS